MPERKPTPISPEQRASDAVSPWPNRLAWLLAGAIFPLIWVGGLVTTTEAGMAVPDYPSTFGYNPLLYPISTWLNGPWSVFIEHGHRLLAGVIILMVFPLLVSCFKCESRRWVRWLTALALVLVLIQALLGGFRVLLDQRTLAMWHACIAHLFFGLAVTMAVVTGPWWREQRPTLQAGQPAHLKAALVRQCTLLLPLLIYVQIVFGAALRHFHVGVWFHVGLAFVVAAYVMYCWRVVRRLQPRDPALTRPASLLVVVVLGQWLLGLGTWITNYGFPAILGESAWSAQFTVQAYSTGQVVITTAHVALGSVLFVTSVALALRAWRLLRPSEQPAQSSPRGNIAAEPTSAMNRSLLLGGMLTAACFAAGSLMAGEEWVR